MSSSPSGFIFERLWASTSSGWQWLETGSTSSLSGKNHAEGCAAGKEAAFSLERTVLQQGHSILFTKPRLDLPWLENINRKNKDGENPTSAWKRGTVCFLRPAGVEGQLNFMKSRGTGFVLLYYFEIESCVAQASHKLTM